MEKVEILNFYISTFKNENMPKDFKFTIIGTPKAEVSRLDKYVKELGLEKNVEVKKLDQTRRSN